MELLSYIFHIGIVYTIFQFLWWLFRMVIKSLFNENASKIEQYLLKPAGYYILVALTVVTASQFMGNSTLNNAYYFFPIVGGLVLYAYLMGKMEQRRFLVQLNNRVVNQRTPAQLKYEPIYIAVALVLYTVAFYVPEIAINEFVLGLFESIENVYKTPVIGWIFGLVGVFFLISMIFRAVAATGKLLDKLLGRTPPSGGSPKSGGGFTYTNDTDSEGFTEYEEVDDDESPDDPPDSQLLS